MKKRYNFYLNPHDEYKWTKCPKCDSKTKVRKFCLVIHYKEKTQKPRWKNLFKNKFSQILSLNKSCKFCPNCELIIGQKSDLDILISNVIIQLNNQFHPDSYLILGTMDKKEWLRNQKEPIHPAEALNLIYHFKDVWDFDIQPAGWYFDGK